MLLPWPSCLRGDKNRVCAEETQRANQIMRPMRQDGFSPGVFIALGVAVGAGLAVALHNTAEGIGVGVAIGAACAVVRRKRG